MSGYTGDSIETIDGRTSRSICDAVGRRLQQSVQPDFSPLPDHLRSRMDALRRQDAQTDQR